MRSTAVGIVGSNVGEITRIFFAPAARRPAALREATAPPPMITMVRVVTSSIRG